MRTLTLFIAFLVLLFGCQDEKDREDSLVSMPEPTEDFSFEIDTIKLMTPGTSPAFPYLVWSQDYSDRGLFTGLDMKQHTLYFLDTKKMEYQSSLKLYEDGPNEITPLMVGGFYYHSPDSIFVLQNIPNRLMMIDREGERELFIELKKVFKGDPVFEGLNAYSMYYWNGIYYMNDKLYFELIREDYTRRDNKYPVIGYYDLNTEEFKALDIQFPEVMKDAPESYDIFPNIRYYKEFIYINYSYSADLYIYDLEGNIINEIAGHNRFRESEPYNPVNKKTKSEHYAENSAYDAVEPFENGNYFIQAGKGPEPPDPEKEIYEFTIVYNSDFSKFRVIDHRGRPFTFGGKYFYYPIPQAETGYQLLERYRVVE
ncbi:DUF4221 family protein [Membranihabitans maritimus]|uniref:DUF4221 family protein n=1 Tax=Membranihabitans maritimus TaxID=2904244 RepID=UPI001F38F8C7|nr:DUF4221 family protein [Membranihabitans maritimus]